MPAQVTSDPSDEAYGVQRIVARSTVFVRIPLFFILILTINLGWEVFRQNISVHTQGEWPFRFTIINSATTASLLAVVTGLFLTRLQYAHAQRPLLTFAIDDKDARFKPDSREWRFWLYNTGSGGSVVEHIEYYIKFHDRPSLVEDWVSLAVANDQMASRTLADGTDFFIRWYSKGTSVPRVNKPVDGAMLAWFDVKALGQLERFDIRIRVMDGLGDSHERIFPCIQRLPSVAEVAIRNLYQKPTP